MKRLKRFLLLAAITPAFLVTDTPPAGANHDNCAFHNVSSIAIGSVNSTNQRDWYSRTVGVVPVTTYTLTMSGGDADLYVYGPNSCQTLACSSARGGSTTDSCQEIGMGTYFIEVRWFSGTNVNYTLSITSP